MTHTNCFFLLSLHKLDMHVCYCQRLRASTCVYDEIIRLIGKIDEESSWIRVQLFAVYTGPLCYTFSLSPSSQTMCLYCDLCRTYHWTNLITANPGGLKCWTALKHHSKLIYMNMWPCWKLCRVHNSLFRTKKKSGGRERGREQQSTFPYAF